LGGEHERSPQKKPRAKKSSAEILGRIARRLAKSAAWRFAKRPEEKTERR
jgi:hypothetical protein